MTTAGCCPCVVISLLLSISSSSSLLARLSVLPTSWLLSSPSSLLWSSLGFLRELCGVVAAEALDFSRPRRTLRGLISFLISFLASFSFSFAFVLVSVGADSSFSLFFSCSFSSTSTFSFSLRAFAVNFLGFNLSFGVSFSFCLGVSLAFGVSFSFSWSNSSRLRRVRRVVPAGVLGC